VATCRILLLPAAHPGRGRRPQPGSQRQDLGEHLVWHRDLGQLKGHIAAVADHLPADLDQLLVQAG